MEVGIWEGKWSLIFSEPYECIYLSGIGSSDHTRSSRGAVGKSSSMLSLESTAGGDESLKFKHLQTTQ